MNSQSRYIHLFGYFICLGDWIILNSVLFLTLFFLDNHLSESFNMSSRVVWLCLNISYFIQLPWLLKFHNTRYMDRFRLFRDCTFNSILTSIFFLSLTVFVKVEDPSRLFLIIVLGGFYLTRLLFWFISREALTLYRKKGYNFRTAIILGGGKSGLTLCDKFSQDISLGYKLIGFFDDNPELKSHKYYLGPLCDMYSYIENNKVDDIFCTLPHTIGDEILKMIKHSEDNFSHFFIIPNSFVYLKRKVILNEIGEIPFFALRSEPLSYPVNKLLKRAFDIFFSGLILITVFPIVYIIVGCLIKLSSPGPIFFKQLRTGIKGKEFYCYKFRSMKINNDADKLQALKNDPRKTKLGNFLRKSSLDELPQFINVFKGNMSVVGPRPHMLKHTEEYSKLVDRYMLRHFIKPGITGWAQINGYRGETKTINQMHKRVLHDVWYMENWSFALDLKIVAKTITNAVKGEENAY